MEKMKIYEVGGRKVWLKEAPEGYKAPKKPTPVKEIPKAEEPEDEPEKELEKEPETKAKKTPANKARKAGSNK